MKTELGVAGRRMCRGTWLALDGWGRWLGGSSHADRAGTVRLGVILRRLVGFLFAVVFYGSILQRAPVLIYALPVAWLIGAWQMSDTSATPPPRVVAPESDEDAGRRSKRARGATDPNGVMCIIHPTAEQALEAERQRLQAYVNRVYAAREKTTEP